jgi:hypothetical protein
MEAELPSNGRVTAVQNLIQSSKRNMVLSMTPSPVLPGERSTNLHKHSGLLVIGRMGFPEGLGTGSVASLV